MEQRENTDLLENKANLENQESVVKVIASLISGKPNYGIDGSITFVIKDSNGEIVEQASCKYNVRVVSYEISGTSSSWNNLRF